MKRWIKKATKTWKNILLWFVLWTIRLLKRPFFLFTLCLIPVMVLLIAHSSLNDDAILRVAIYTDAAPDTFTGQLMQELIHDSGKTLCFYPVTSEKQLKKDIRTKKAISGYILPKNLKKQLKNYEQKKTPFIRAIQHETEMTNNIVNEIILSKIYQTHAGQILEEMIKKKDPDANEDTMAFLKQKVAGYQSHELLFRFEYANGEINEVLNGNGSGILLMPLRGVISVMILLACMAGNLLWYEDVSSGISTVSNKWMQRYLGFFSLFVPTVYASLSGLLSLYLSNVAESLSRELCAMACFLFACLSLIYGLKSIFSGKELFLSTIPVWVIGSLICCPVFINLAPFSFLVRSLRYLFPTHYYLPAIHDPGALWQMLIYSCVLLAAGYGINKAKRKY